VDYQDEEQDNYQDEEQDDYQDEEQDTRGWLLAGCTKLCLKMKIAKELK
jgi:hypothetical protein